MSRIVIPLTIRRTLMRALEAYGGDDAEVALEFVRTMPVATLTEREVEIMRQVARGYTNQEIARMLVNKSTGDGSLSERTVRDRVSDMLSKLELGNRTELALWALRHKIAALDELDEDERFELPKEASDEDLRSMFASSVDVRTNGVRHGHG